MLSASLEMSYTGENVLTFFSIVRIWKLKNIWNVEYAFHIELRYCGKLSKLWFCLELPWVVNFSCSSINILKTSNSLIHYPARKNATIFANMPRPANLHMGFSIKKKLNSSSALFWYVIIIYNLYMHSLQCPYLHELCWCCKRNTDAGGRRGYRFYWGPVMHISQIAKLMGSTGGPPGSGRPQMGPMLAPWALLSGMPR